MPVTAPAFFCHPERSERCHPAVAIDCHPERIERCHPAVAIVCHPERKRGISRSNVYLLQFKGEIPHARYARFGMTKNKNARFGMTKQKGYARFGMTIQKSPCVGFFFSVIPSVSEGSHDRMFTCRNTKVRSLTLATLGSG